MKNYKNTIRTCYISNLTQAIVINISPVLFIPLMNIYNFSFEQLGRLILINFLTQLLADLAFSRVVDKYGIRPFAIFAHISIAVGLILFATAQYIFTNIYNGLVIATFIFSIGGGLLELLLSPIIANIPFEEKDKAMSRLHSMYSWGQALTVVVTTLLLFVFSQNDYYIIVLIWAIVPILNIFLFSKVWLPDLEKMENKIKISYLLKNKFFIICLFAILLGGASEIIISQWTSSYLEKIANIPKVVGDILGVALFAVAMGFGRSLYGKFGEKINLFHGMMAGCLLSTVCYLIVGFSQNSILIVTACILCGIGVSLLWPGAITVSSNKFPLAGATMFAFLAAAGDSGASFGPWVISLFADKFSLRIGMVAASLIPLILFFLLIYLQKHSDTDII